MRASRLEKRNRGQGFSVHHNHAGIFSIEELSVAGASGTRPLMFHQWYEVWIGFRTP
jgi:hypothetical protein